MKFLKTEEKRENISKDIDKKASKKVFINLIIAIAIMAYFCLFSLAYKLWLHDNIDICIKIATMVFLIISLVLIEIAYKKESKTLVIHAFEALALAIHSLTTMYITKINNFDINNYILLSSYGFSIYYVLKTIIITTRARKEFLNGLSDISEIVKKEEPKKKEASKKDKKKKIKEEIEIENLEVDNIEDELDVNDDVDQELEEIDEEDLEDALEIIANEEVENNKEDASNNKLAQLREKIKRLQEEDKKLSNSIKNDKNVEEDKKTEEKENKAKKENGKNTTKKTSKEINNTTAKKRGRPKKEVSTDQKIKEKEVDNTKPKKRGRPKKEV